MELNEFAKVFLIAGSEPLGSAGMQGDIKAISACGGFAACAVTCIVNEDTSSIKGIHTLPTELIVGQAHSFLSDVGADCIKTGLLYNKEIIDAVADLLQNYPQTPLLVDPVMVNSAGIQLIADDAIEAYRKRLFPIADIITPNFKEAEVLCGKALTLENVEEEIRKIGNHGCSVIIKSLRNGDYLTDVFYNREDDSVRRFAKLKVDTSNVNGTGDTFASAIATYVARKYDLATAVEKAEVFIHESISHGATFRFGPGWGPVHPFYRTIGFFEEEDRRYADITGREVAIASARRD